MQIVLIITIAFIIAFIPSCATLKSDETRAKQILKQIDEIAQKPVSGRDSQELLQAMNRLYEAKETFPNHRDQIMADAQAGKQFFTSSIDGHQRIIGKFEELLTMRLSGSDSECVQMSIEVQRAQIEQMEWTLSQIILFLDESIKDKETLDSKSFQLRENANVAEIRFEELKQKQSISCSKSALGVK